MRNVIAVILKVLAIVITVVAVILVVIGIEELEGVGGMLTILYAVVLSFSIYTYGEVIQLLQDIKNNTGGCGVKQSQEQLPGI